MEVTELTAETFWKGETEIRGTVMDGEDAVSYTHLTLPTIGLV